MLDARGSVADTITVMHRESKNELMDRLRREGRWEAFVKRREELKAEGVPAKEAWWQAATEFPPPNGNGSSGSNGSAPKPDLSALKGKPAVTIAEAVAWASENLDCDSITPADAPSAGAWSMLQWARSSMAARGEFYRNFVVKFLAAPQEAKRAAEAEREERKRASHARRDSMINDLLKDRQKNRMAQDGGGGN
jgi:hypothetical protein